MNAISVDGDEQREQGLAGHAEFGLERGEKVPGESRAVAMMKLQAADLRARRRALMVIVAIAGLGVIAMLGLERWLSVMGALEPAEASRLVTGS